MHKLLTLEDFMNFCQTYCLENKIQNFSLTDLKEPTEIIVQTPGTFKTFDTDDERNDGFLPVSLDACHINLNRNGSFISKENMEKALSTIYNRPILGKIIQNDKGEYDFDQHNMQVVADDQDPQKTKLHYEEQPIGIIPESGNAHLRYDSEQDKTYVNVNGLIFSDYGNEAESIIKRKGGTKVSVELAIKDMSYNAKENYMEILDFEFRGVTALGEHVGEGMLGSKMTLSDFSAKENSCFNNSEIQTQMIEALTKLNTFLSHLEKNSESTQEGGTATLKLQELLEKYNKTVEDLTFDYEGLSDEELEAQFEQNFTESDDTDNPDEPENSGEPDTSDDSENFSGKQFTVHEDGHATVSFELSFDEIRNALWNLLDQFDQLDNTWYFIRDVYDDYFVMQDWDSNTIYKQGYVKDGDSVKLEGERVRLYEELLTESEMASLKDMRENYAQLKSFKEETVLAQENAKKEEELQKDCYSSIRDTEDFKSLMEHMSDYSLDEIVNKADLLLGKAAKAGQFAAQPVVDKPTMKIGIDVPVEKKDPYGHLFDGIDED